MVPEEGAWIVEAWVPRLRELGEDGALPAGLVWCATCDERPRFEVEGDVYRCGACRFAVRGLMLEEVVATQVVAGICASRKLAPAKRTVDEVVETWNASSTGHQARVIAMVVARIDVGPGEPAAFMIRWRATQPPTSVLVPSP